MAQTALSLEDKYTVENGRVYLTGTQALVRLPIMQRQRDLAAGLNTACFISGYRGSPLGGFDQNLWSAGKFLKDNHIHFQPGVNEELGATAVWGSQQVGMFPGARYDGVFAMWYGKGPGVDRSGDALRHGNAAGSSRHGGVLVLAGDDHACKSSSVPHQSEHAFVHGMIPVLNPAGVQEILDYGLLGWAMSRYSGCWIALKTIAETVDSSASVLADPQRAMPVLPDDFVLPPGGLNIRWPDPPLEQEHRLMRHKLYAALAFARANRLDRVVIAAPRPRLGIVTTGKSYLDVRQTLDELGISEAMAADLGISVYKVGMPWPLEREGIRRFAEGLEEIVVVEEKRALIENQLKEQLYNWHPDVRPRVIGKFDESGDWILPSTGELSPAQIAVVIGRRLLAMTDNQRIAERVAFLDAQERQKSFRARVERKPTFCSGCPHNTSTVVPEGSRAVAGIGCHYLVLGLDRRTETFTQMGGEGVPWVGQAPFTDETHIFANLGDGTYYHSGSLAVRQAIAAGVNITYKILFNDAVAMTGGQPIDGILTVPMIAQEMLAEGARRVVVVTDAPEKYADGAALPAGVKVEPRADLDRVQKELRGEAGVTILIYDQVCATEKRRRRKRGTMAEPGKRVLINELVCESCGDCSVQSNCVSIVPRDTEFGRKRQIDQSSCNRDFSCLKGFCPSFVTVHGGALRKPPTLGKDALDLSALPEPTRPELDRPWGIYVTGVGGTGVVTLGALLGLAAHIEGKGVSVLDITGMAQKGGAVTSHIRIGRSAAGLHAVRIAAGGADAIIGCDIVVAAAGDCLSKIQPGRTHAIINTHEAVTADFVRERDFKVPVTALAEDIKGRLAGGRLALVDATRLATALLGDSIAANPFMLGYAWQAGAIPLSEQALLDAITVNGVAVGMNRTAFALGRLAAHDPARLEALAVSGQQAGQPSLLVDLRRRSANLDEIIERRVSFLTAYQNAAYAARYRKLVERVRDVERRKTPDKTALTTAVAEYGFKLFAYKDEYEVARLYTQSGFLQQVAEMFEGDYRLEFNLAPPLFSRRTGPDGRTPKRTYGPRMLWVFRLLAAMRGVRGSLLDPFRWLPDRRAERELIADYLATIDELLLTLNDTNHAVAVKILSLPADIRGYGPVKTESIARATQQRLELLALYRGEATQGLISL